MGPLNYQAGGATAKIVYFNHVLDTSKLKDIF